jgi:hypothetical protein
MPTALHPQAKFDPIPPDLDLHSLVENTANFEWAKRITVPQMQRLSAQDFENLVTQFVVKGGRPLVISGWDQLLPNNIFNGGWLQQTYDKKRTYSPFRDSERAKG